MSEETIEDKTAAAVQARRNKGGRPPKVVEKATEDDGASQNDASADAPAVVVNVAPEPKPEPKAKKRLFPVTMLRNYHPIKDFLINGVEPSAEQRVKVPAGASIEMDIDEARDVIAKGIATRNDPIG